MEALYALETGWHSTFTPWGAAGYFMLVYVTSHAAYSFTLYNNIYCIIIYTVGALCALETGWHSAFVPWVPAPGYNMII